MLEEFEMNSFKFQENIKLAPLTPLPDFEFNAFKFTTNGVEYYQLNNKK